MYIFGVSDANCIFKSYFLNIFFLLRPQWRFLFVKSLGDVAAHRCFEIVAQDALLAKLNHVLGSHLVKVLEDVAVARRQAPVGAVFFWLQKGHALVPLVLGKGLPVAIVHHLGRVEAHRCAGGIRQGGHNGSLVLFHPGGLVFLMVLLAVELVVNHLGNPVFQKDLGVGAMPGGKRAYHKCIGHLGVKDGSEKGNDCHQTQAEGNDEFRAGIAALVVDLLDRISALFLLALVPGGTALVFEGCHNAE
mmetsp:Transcript_8554/g.21032  ORF Transcript_8554/g.21032 Transcript_8554/m.21032 type:complete len:247 (+) Transcript_8554:1562-2302(+)